MYMKLKPNKHKIISFNTTTMTSLGFIIVGSPPSPNLLKKKTVYKQQSLNPMDNVPNWSGTFKSCSK